MRAEEFLSLVTSDTGHRCVFAVKDGRRVQKFFDDTEEFLDTTFSLDTGGYDTYFALASFSQPSNRTQSNAAEMKAFFLDLDCGPGKEFSSPSAAIGELRQFCETTGLPKPSLVGSGRGVHVYWPLREPVSVAQWTPVAERLKRLCAEHGFGADPAVTADAARVLRLPGTHNYKDDPAPTVQYLTAIGKPNPVEFKTFSKLVGVNGTHHSLNSDSPDDPFGIDLSLSKKGKNMRAAMVTREIDHLLSSQVSVFKNILVKTMHGHGCAQLGHIIEQEGNVSEPLWRAGLSIAKHCEDAEKAAHAMSHGHPEYDPEDTEVKMRRIKGPYLCERFDEYRTGVCSECPNWGKIKSPIVLGSEVVEAEADEEVEDTTTGQTYTIPKYPKPYFRGKNGGVFRREVVKDDDGNDDFEDKMVFHRDIYVVMRVIDPDPDIKDCAVVRVHLPQDGTRDFTVPNKMLNSREELRKVLASNGVLTANPKQQDELMRYLVHWVNELQETQVADISYRQFGWTSKDHDCFLLGDKKITATEIKFNPPSTATIGMVPYFEPKGTLEQWKKNIAFFNKEGMELHQFAVCMGFGAPLMDFTSHSAMALHLFSGGSGFGKTTLKYAAISAFGSPKDLVLTQRDTQNSIMNRAEVYKNILLPVDELTNAHPEALSNYVYNLPEGRQKNRMSGGSNIERVRGAPWALLSLTSANASISEVISRNRAIPEAEAQRMMEYNVQRYDKLNKREADKLHMSLQNNYGHAGVIFLQYVMQNREFVQETLEKIQEKVDARADLTSQNRFWSAGVAATLTGMIICRKLGLLDYDPNKVFDFVINVLLERNKRAIVDLNISNKEIISNYIHENIDKVLIIKSTNDVRKALGVDKDNEVVIPESAPRGQLVARYEPDTKLLYLMPKPLKEWCVRHQISAGNLTNALIKEMKGHRRKVRFDKGTQLRLPPTSAIIIEMDLEMDDDEDAARQENL